VLAHYLAFGLIGAAGGGGGGGSDTGEILATGDRTAVVLVVQTLASSSTGIPLGAVEWSQPYDPADHAPYAVDFSALLPDSEKIAEIEAIAMSATAALLGVEVDDASTFGPVIDVDAGKKVQLWFVVDAAAWQNAAFDINGVRLPVTVRVLTDSIPPKRFERTSVLTVRQL
jgi:hypothetical protein